MAAMMFNWMAQMATGMGGHTLMNIDAAAAAAAAAAGGLGGMQGGHHGGRMPAAARGGWGLPMVDLMDEGLAGEVQEEEEDDGVPPGEGAADGSQVQKLVDMGNYNDGYKWRK
jgi:hypothetical protein